MAETKPTVTVDLEQAALIMRAFLPSNPNKLRKPHMEREDLRTLRQACFDFGAAVRAATRQRDQELGALAEKMGREMLEKKMKGSA